MRSAISWIDSRSFVERWHHAEPVLTIRRRDTKDTGPLRQPLRNMTAKGNIHERTIPPRKMASQGGCSVKSKVTSSRAHIIIRIGREKDERCASTLFLAPDSGLLNEFIPHEQKIANQDHCWDDSSGSARLDRHPGPDIEDDCVDAQRDCSPKTPGLL